MYNKPFAIGSRKIFWLDSFKNEKHLCFEKKFSGQKKFLSQYLPQAKNLILDMGDNTEVYLQNLFYFILKFALN